MTTKHQTLEFPPCPVETNLTLISNRWRVLIIRDLLGGTKRFGELQRSVGSISQKVLTANLREMEQMGIVGPHEGSKPRQVLITYAQWLEMNMQKQDNPGDA